MKKLLILLFLFLIFSYPAYSSTKDDIIKLSKSGTSYDHIISYLKINGFQKLSEENINELVKSGVDDKVIDFLKEHNSEVNCKYRKNDTTLKEETEKWLRQTNYRHKE